jgi:hypothetical protein
MASLKQNLKHMETPRLKDVVIVFLVFIILTILGYIAYYLFGI